MWFWDGGLKVTPERPQSRLIVVLKTRLILGSRCHLVNVVRPMGSDRALQISDIWMGEVLDREILANWDGTRHWNATA